MNERLRVIEKRLGDLDGTTHGEPVEVVYLVHEYVHTARSAVALARDLNIELQEAVQLLGKWASFSKRLPATLEYDALAEDTDAFLARLEGENNG